MQRQLETELAAAGLDLGDLKELRERHEAAAESRVAQAVLRPRHARYSKTAFNNLAANRQRHDAKVQAKKARRRAEQKKTRRAMRKAA